jgi:hypothetical protein
MIADSPFKSSPSISHRSKTGTGISKDNITDERSGRRDRFSGLKRIERMQKFGLIFCKACQQEIG